MKNLNSKIRPPASPAERTVVAAVTAQLAALQPDQVRITLMHSERKETSYNLGKGNGPEGPSGKPGERFFSREEVIGLVPFLLSENGNRRGYNVFITPFSDTVWYILLDDIVPAKLAELDGLRLTPQMLIESSPQRFQGLFMLPKDLATKDEANALFRMINARHGDPKISGLTHPFRAIGFRNMKPKYQKPNGLYPVRRDGVGRETDARRTGAATRGGQGFSPRDRAQGAAYKKGVEVHGCVGPGGSRPGDDEVRPGALPAAGVAIWQGV